MTQTQSPTAPVGLTAAAAYPVPQELSDSVIRDRLADVDGTAVWVEQVRAPAGSVAALRRRRRELRRSLPVGIQADRRAVLLRFPDGSAELVLVLRTAPGAARAGLDVLARRILAPGAGSPAVVASATVPAPAAPSSAPAVDVVPDLGTDPDPLAELRNRAASGPDRPSATECRRAAWAGGETAAAAADALGALAVLIWRHTGTRGVLLGLGGDRAVSVEIPEDATVARLRAVVSEALAAAVVSPAGSAGSPQVGVLVDPGVPLLDPVEYLPAHQPPYPVTWYVDAGAGRLACEYRRDEFPDWLATGWASQLGAIHQELTGGDQDRPLSRGGWGAQPASAGSDGAVSSGTDGAGADALSGGLLHEVFSARAAETPEAVAVVCGADRVTYEELELRSRTIAHSLHTLGVTRGDRVGVMLGRSADLPAFLLGVLRCGAAYVPIDPGYPAERIAYVCADADLALLLTEDDATPVDDVRSVPGSRLLVSAEAQPAVAPAAEATVGTGDAAYVIYTSGSTGRPKGVVVPHGNVLALLAATEGDFGLGPADVWTWFHSVAFDFSVWEIWGCLLTGGRLVVVPDEVRTSPEDFHQLLETESVTVLNQTPTAFGQLQQVACSTPTELALRLVVFGGEPLDARALQAWFDRYPPSRCRLVNMFGITETTVHVTATTVTRALALQGSRSVGRPLPGWTVRIVDERQQPLPFGAVGEIVVGGAGLALHYLNRPALTAQRFVTDPVTGERWYLSGDRGRLLPDGSLEHLGRVDNQVKIRGHRIEPDEVRAVLLADPRVAAAAVVLGHAIPGDRATARLEAYVVPAAGADTAGEAERIRRRAADILPGYMMPATFTLMAGLPLTANGKLDLRQLAATVKEVTSGPTPPVAPPGPVVPVDGTTAEAERQEAGLPFHQEMLEVWRTVLGPHCGLDDHFFDLGGNSLLTVRLTTALRERGIGPVRVRDVYQHPTARRLAELVTRNSTNAASADRTPSKEPSHR